MYAWNIRIREKNQANRDSQFIFVMNNDHKGVRQGLTVFKINLITVSWWWFTLTIRNLPSNLPGKFCCACNFHHANSVTELFPTNDMIVQIVGLPQNKMQIILFSICHGWSRLTDFWINYRVMSYNDRCGRICHMTWISVESLLYKSNTRVKWENLFRLSNEQK